MIAFSLTLFIAISGAWNPYRWGMVRGLWLDVVPVAFYGQVVDEQGNPLQDVEVELEVYTVNWFFLVGADSPGRERLYDLRTDERGNFALPRDRGKSIEIRSLKKSGFEWQRHTNEGSYYFHGPAAHPKPHQPDRSKPEVFVLHPVDPRPR